jgi:hypothetical protein
MFLPVVRLPSVVPKLCVTGNRNTHMRAQQFDARLDPAWSVRMLYETRGGWRDQMFSVKPQTISDSNTNSVIGKSSAVNISRGEYNERLVCFRLPLGRPGFRVLRRGLFWRGSTRNSGIEGCGCIIVSPSVPGLRISRWFASGLVRVVSQRSACIRSTLH